MGLILGGDTGNLLGTDFNHSSLLRLALTHLLSGVCPTDKMEKKPLNVPRKYVAQQSCKMSILLHGAKPQEKPINSDDVGT